MDPRTIFLSACATIGDAVAGFGFKPTQQGQRLKRRSPDKDIVSELFFQSSFRNSSSDITIIPHVHLYSRMLKPWAIEQTKNEHSSGLIYTNNLGYISPRKRYASWNLAGASRDAVVAEIAGLIEKHALPIVSLFDSKEKAVQFMSAKGARFNEWAEPSLAPLDFMIRFAPKPEAEAFFNGFVEACSYKRDIVRLYESLASAPKIDLNHSEFHHADKVKLAFVNGLRLTSRRSVTR